MKSDDLTRTIPQPVRERADDIIKEIRKASDELQARTRSLTEELQNRTDELVSRSRALQGELLQRRNGADVVGWYRSASAQLLDAANQYRLVTRAELEALTERVAQAEAAAAAAAENKGASDTNSSAAKKAPAAKA